MNIGKTGELGEKKAKNYLFFRGYKIIEQNYQTRFGEIDIIAVNKEYIVFAEVKTRNVKSLISPKEFVDSAKQKKIIKTAEIYLSKSPCDLQPRFDVIEVIVDEGKSRINHIKNAFELS